MTRRWVFPASLIAAVAFSLLTARAPSSQGAPTYVGSDACKDCHEAQWTSYEKNVHRLADVDQKRIADRTGCESCHGPGSEHVAAAGDRDHPGFASIRNFRTISPEQASETCMGCHKTGRQMNFRTSEHARGEVGCTSCHGIHAAVTRPSLLKAEGTNQLCLTCHRDKRAQLAKSAHMPLREGGMDCASCHDPHGGTGPHQIRTASAQELCLSCHADKRGPVLWEHAPVRQDCMNCHQPHGSNNPRLLAGKLPYLCQRCHIFTRHPSTLYDLPDLASNRLVNRSCTNCHSQVHGSNHPSGRFFLR